MWQFLLASALFLTAADCKDAGKSGSSPERCGCQKTPIFYGSLPVGRPVYGVQPIGNEIYVIRDSTPYIEVYNRYTFKPKRNITVTGMQGPYDMVQSRQSPVSLFIADWFNNNTIITVRIPQETASTWSSVENSFTSLGLAGSNPYTNGNIIVTAATSKKLKKFGVSGNLIKEILIQSISSPRQSIQVNSDRYAVCHGYGPPPELHRVCLVDSSGKIYKCFGGTRGSSDGQLNIPGRLELFKNNCIMVADTGNKRVILLDRDLGFVRNLISSQLDGPYRLYFDRENDLLFVADNKVDDSGIAVSGRVVVYKF